ncbi:MULTISPECIES: flagellar biosynthetic protein FliO [Methylobacterium]|uniref:flagellar biosynthetic protein FliO n=1 Tax=Methylobacterium TaxID=407 RepID=UPI001EE26514|nr:MULTISPECIES: flagellar biosynthetic protein FliO [Methylobacterium]
MQYVAIFAVIFAVLTVIVLVVRRLGGGGLADAKRGGQRGRQPRLGIVDVYELDRQRQLILLRRDNVEHLLLVGGPNDVVIERHIQRGQQRDPALRPEAMAEPLAAPFAETLAEAGPDPFSGLETQAQAAFRPDFSMPIVLAPTVSGPGGALASAASLAVPPLDAALLDDSELRPDRVSEPRASEAIVTGPRPDAPARRPMRRTAPPLINPRPDVASERPRTEAAPPEEPASASVPVPGAIPPIPPLPPAERRPVDPAILSDMARQLEAALARPASAVAPARSAPPTFSDPVPVSAPAPEAPAAVDPMAAAMAAPVDSPLPQAEKPAAAPFAIPPAPAPKPEPFLPAPPPVEPVPPAPPAAVEPRVPPKAEPAPPPKAAEPAPAKSAPGKSAPGKSAANPFSVEEIEAEFARLLGRPLDKRN